jgi:hypothetical protein
MTTEKLNNQQKEMLEKLLRQLFNVGNKKLNKEADSLPPCEGLTVKFDKDIKESTLDYCIKTKHLELTLNTNKVEISTTALENCWQLFLLATELSAIGLVSKHMGNEASEKIADAIKEKYNPKMAA